MNSATSHPAAMVATGIAIASREDRRAGPEEPSFANLSANETASRAKSRRTVLPITSQRAATSLRCDPWRRVLQKRGLPGQPKTASPGSMPRSVRVNNAMMSSRGLI